MRYLLFLLAGVVFFSCQNASKPATAAAPISDAQNPLATTSGEPLPQGFVEFYEKFHTDSVFQMQRIQFPLKGEEVVEVNDSTRALAPMTWTAENWALHRTPDLQGDIFKRTFTTLGEDMVIEVISNENLGLRQERRFARVAGDDWTLIYFFKM